MEEEKKAVDEDSDSPTPDEGDQGETEEKAMALEGRKILQSLLLLRSASRFLKVITQKKIALGLKRMTMTSMLTRNHLGLLKLR